jgi:2-oxoglutarate-Fe(II)-dependent oxygenase superfamily protein
VTLAWGTLEAAQGTLAHRFPVAQPFPHLVIDGLFDDPEQIARAFAQITAPMTARVHLHSRKATLDKIEHIPWNIVRAIYALHGPRWLRWLEAVTGIAPLLPDWTLFGGGVHVSRRGGFLDIHADFQDHPVTGHRRALNLLVYFNYAWRPSWRGELELWDRDMRQPVKVIPPILNRAVIFATSATSYHGHPAKLRCPEDVARQSLALYYYRPAEHAPGLQTTDYRPRPQDYVKRLRKFARRLWPR